MQTSNDFPMKKQKLREYFMMADEIRIFVDGSPAFGHAASTIAILKRFIALGFASKIRVVYHKGLDEVRPTVQKLEILLPGFDRNHPDQSILVESQNKKATVSFTLLGSSELPPAPFAISGGYDDAKPPSPLAKSSPALDVFRQLNVDWFVVLQPFTWERAPNAAFFKTAPAPAFVALDSYAKQLPDYYKQCYYRPFPAMSAQDWQHFLELPTLKEDARKRIALARAVVDTLEKKPHVDLCPVYGIADVASDSKTIVEADSWLVLLNLIAGIRTAARERAAVVLVLADLKPENYLHLMNAMHGAFSDLGLNEHLMHYITKHLQGKVKISLPTESAENVQQVIETLQSDEILVLSMPGLPPDIFDLFYGLATLPAVFEGAGTAGMIVNVGKPYLRLAGRDQVLYPVIPSAQQNEIVKELARIAYLLQTGRTQWPSDPQVSPASQLGTFITECYKSDGKIATYFSDVYNYFHDEEHDKLLAGLLFLLESREFKRLSH